LLIHIYFYPAKSTLIQVDFLMDKKNGEKSYMEVTDRIGVDLDEVEVNDRRLLMVVEDDPDTIFLLKQILRVAGYNVVSAMQGQEALKKIIEHKPDLVLLDLMLPEMDGWEIYSYIRQMTDVPVIIISALDNKDEVVRGLHQGVDDYITKPFHNAEVVERVRAVLRRSGKNQEINRLVFPKVGLTIDFLAQQAYINTTNLDLTPKEFAVLAVLAKQAPAIARYETIAQAVWRSDSPEARNRTKYLVYLLRRKLEEAHPGSNLILNLDRRGYKLNTGD
jgi:DNA-binding response OmpR family regulator